MLGANIITLLWVVPHLSNVEATYSDGPRRRSIPGHSALASPQANIITLFRVVLPRRLDASFRGPS